VRRVEPCRPGDRNRWKLGGRTAASAWNTHRGSPVCAGLARCWLAASWGHWSWPTTSGRCRSAAQSSEPFSDLVAAPRRGSTERSRPTGVLRGPDQHTDPPGRSPSGPGAGPLLRVVVHTRPGGRAGTQPELPRQPSAPLHRTLFDDVRVRQAVNYAIGRRAPARLGDFLQPLPERPTDHYLPPGMPAFRHVHVYPTRPDVVKARTLVRQAHAGRRWARCCETAPWSHASTIRSTGASSPARRGALPRAAPRMNVTRSRY
jgi:hypothetical protein